MPAYYNEIDPFAAEWLRNLIAAGHIAPGDVDERSIAEVSADDLRGYVQCHFFAGIGVWSHALRHAGWEDDRPVWTGSCPCQPFSAAGKQGGFDDARHLWPVWYDLIAECRPPVVVGEQVASALDWLDLVQADMEGAGYAFGASDLCAAGFGGAHIRQRLYFVGLADFGGERRKMEIQHASSSRASGREWETDVLGICGTLSSGVGVSSYTPRPGAADGGWRDADWLLCRDGKWRPVESGTFPLAHAAPARVGRLRAYGNGLDAETATQFLGAVRQSLELIDLV